ncbi:MAG TPA: hypothetical protein VG722_01745, partial [Tepidisphaeraceae bacterium]|nr:hypothetical protein [Tepidisphaeraceae bacterium]
GKGKTSYKKLIGSLNETFNGQVVTGKVMLNRSTSTSGSVATASDLALAPGYTPNETPPPITSGIGSATSPFNTGSTIDSQLGLTGGDQTGGSLLSDSGSLLG